MADNQEFEELQNLEEKDTLEQNQGGEPEALIDNSGEEVKDKPQEKWQKELQSALAQKEHFRRKAEKLEAERRALEQKLTSAGQGSYMPTDPLEIVKLGKALGNYSEEEVEFIIRHAQDKTTQGIINATKDEWVQAAIQARRAKVAQEKERLEPSTRTSPSKKRIEDISPSELKKLTPEERQKWYKAMGIIK
jgi:hypothetical protein